MNTIWNVIKLMVQIPIAIIFFNGNNWRNVKETWVSIFGTPAPKESPIRASLKSEEAKQKFDENLSSLNEAAEDSK